MQRHPALRSLSSDHHAGSLRYHALERLFDQVSAGKLMRTGIEPLHPDTRLDQAAQAMVEQGRKGLPVVDADGRLRGVLLRKDFVKACHLEDLL